MLTEVQIHHLAEKINEEINLNILGEKMEQHMFWFIVKGIDKKLQLVLPPEMYHVLFSVTQGLEDTDADNLGIRLLDYLKVNVDIPIVSKENEELIINIFTLNLVAALKKGSKFDYSWEELKRI